MAATRRSVREHLETLDDAAWVAASEVRPKFISKSDPAAQWTGALKGNAFFAYAVNYLFDLDHGVIVDVEASRAIRQAEVGAARTMIDRIQDQFGLYPERVAADSAYGSAEMLGWLVHERGIEPHIPVFDKSQRSDGTFSRDAFAYDHQRDCYICPAGKELRQRQKIYRVPRPLVDEDGMMRYRASKLDCERCSLKPQCCPNAPARKIPRYRRRRSRYGARHRRHRCLCHLKARTKKGRDAVRSPQTHPEARPPAIARTERRPRRVPPCRYGPKPQEAGQAHPNATADPGVKSRTRATSAHYRRSVGFRRRLFQRNPPRASVFAQRPWGGSRP